MTAFRDRVALITGAGSGLGRQLAIELAGAGARVAAVDLKEDPLASLAGELPAHSLAWAVADVTDREALRGAVPRLEREVGPIDLLIANAGIGIETRALSFKAEDVEAVVRVNLIGVANSVDVVLPGMLARRRGQLAAVSSLASYRGFPGMAAYCASKAGVNALMDSLRLELRDEGIAVTTVCPGWIRTPLTANIDFPMPHLMEPADAARRILEAIRRRRPFLAFPRGSAFQVRLFGFLPCAASDWLIRRLLPKLLARE